MSFKESTSTAGQTSKKRKVDFTSAMTLSATPTAGAIVPVPPVVSMLDDDAQAMAELLYRERSRITLDIAPAYVSRLELRKEVGFYVNVANKRMDFTTFDIRVVELRRCMTQVLTRALTVRYYDRSNLRDSEITTEVNTIVPLTVDACMCALYAKLRNIHRSHGRLATRYTQTPHYNKDIELPLPLAVAIQEFGIFQSESLEQNLLCAPTYPEATPYEGRSTDNFNITDYQTYIPTFKDLGIPCKSVDTRFKKGSAWWTYNLRNSEGTTDLICSLPPTLYTDLAASLRMLFLATADDSNECSEIMAWPDEISDFGTHLREATPNSNVRAFLALCHGPKEEWSNGQV